MVTDCIKSISDQNKRHSSISVIFNKKVRNYNSCLIFRQSKPVAKLISFFLKKIHAVQSSYKIKHVLEQNSCQLLIDKQSLLSTYNFHKYSQNFKSS